MKHFNKYGLIVAIIGVAAAAYFYFESQSAALRQQFQSNITEITADADKIELSQDLISIRRNGENWYHVNGSDANFEENKFFTPQGDHGNGNSATLAEFLASTHLSQEQVSVLRNFMTKYSYISEVTSDPNISGTCSFSKENQCTGLKFYLSTAVGSNGYLYTPFDLDSADTDYLQKAYRRVSQFSDQWHEFEAERQPE
jgi:hypothetical protein